MLVATLFPVFASVYGEPYKERRENPNEKNKKKKTNWTVVTILRYFVVDVWRNEPTLPFSNHLLSDIRGLHIIAVVPVLLHRRKTTYRGNTTIIDNFR